MTDYFKLKIAKIVEDAADGILSSYGTYCEETKGIAKYVSEWAANKTLLDEDQTDQARTNVLDGSLGILLRLIDESLPDELAGLRSAVTIGKEERFNIVLVPA